MNIAQELLAIQAVFFRPSNPFIWASGIKSPIYCDNRLIMGYPTLRKAVANQLATTITKTFHDVDIIIGTATAGISHATLIADIMQKPMGYVRSTLKGHGRENAIEGPYVKGQKVVVIEDLISTGQSSIRVVKTLQEAGLHVLGVIAIFSYGFLEAKHAFDEAGIPLVSLTTYQDIVKEAVMLDYLRKEDLPLLSRFSENPRDESWIKP